MRDNRIISERTLTVWILFSVMSGVLLALSALLGLYLICGRFPLGDLPPFLYLLPSIFGSVAGTLLTKRHMIRKSNPSER